jgi:hypothetical protein
VIRGDFYMSKKRPRRLKWWSTINYIS